MTAALAPPVEPDPVVAAAVAGDQRAFGRLVERHRSELYVHCLRLLRCPEQAEDAVQEALLRAWRSRGGYAGRASFRSWLYRIATNACLDEMRRDPARAHRRSVVRLVPLPDDAADPAELPAATEPGPDVVAEAAETLAGAFLAVVELLSPRQRATLVLREVLRCSAVETARLLGCSVPAVNSALQRARGTLAAAGADRAGGRLGAAPPDPVERALLDRYLTALRRHDVAGLVAAARADVASAVDIGRLALVQGRMREEDSAFRASRQDRSGAPSPAL